MQNAMSKESITSSAKKSSKRERTCYCTSFEIELLSLLCSVADSDTRVNKEPMKQLVYAQDLKNFYMVLFCAFLCYNLGHWHTKSASLSKNANVLKV